MWWKKQSFHPKKKEGLLNPTRRKYLPGPSPSSNLVNSKHKAAFLNAAVILRPRGKILASNWGGHKINPGHRCPVCQKLGAEEESELGSEAMATRLARRTIASSSLFRRSTAITVGHGGSESRRPLSSSSSKSEKPEKKKRLDRLSTTIDAVNERKLPPELRGRRNTVRYRWIHTDSGSLLIISSITEFEFEFIISLITEFEFEFEFEMGAGRKLI